MAVVSRAERFDRDGFDMLIDKAPGTATPTPWHQDCAYWIDLPDRRAFVLDRPRRRHGRERLHVVRAGVAPPPDAPAPPGRDGRGALECDGSESEGVPVPLAAGSCTLHHRGTMHYSRGNSTAGHRRALIFSFRPQAMVELERARGFDHGKDAPGREHRNPLTRY